MDYCFFLFRNEYLKNPSYFPHLSRKVLSEIHVRVLSSKCSLYCETSSIVNRMGHLQAIIRLNKLQSKHNVGSKENTS